MRGVLYILKHAMHSEFKNCERSKGETIPRQRYDTEIILMQQQDNCYSRLQQIIQDNIWFCCYGLSFAEICRQQTDTTTLSCIQLQHTIQQYLLKNTQQ